MVSRLDRIIFDPDTTPPLILSGVVATALSTSVIRVSWGAGIDTGGSGLAGYRVYVATASGGPYTLLQSLSTGSLTYDHTGLGSGVTRFYRVTAFDGNNNESPQSQTVQATTQGGGVLTPDQAWLARSTGPGVVAAWGLNSAADIAAGYNPGNNGTRGFLDEVQKVLNGGSLRFDLRAGEAGANISGDWWISDSPYGFLGATFGQGSTLYTQVLYRLSSTMYTNFSHWDGPGDPDWKMLILHQAGGSLCANVELTVKGTSALDFVYSKCGNRVPRGNLNSPIWVGDPITGNYAHQMGWDLASGPSWVNEPNALPQRNYPASIDPFPTNEWFALDVKLGMGNWGQANSSVEVWVTRASEGIRRKKLSISAFLFEHNGSSSNTWGNIWLGPYMTNLEVPAPNDAFMWISGIIISRQLIPIAVLQ